MTEEMIKRFDNGGTCITCSGTGLRNDETLCPTCNGSGGKEQPADRDFDSTVTPAPTFDVVAAAETTAAAATHEGMPEPTPPEEAV